MKQDFPFTVQFGIVDGCNQQCEFCGMQGREKHVNYAEQKTVEHLVRLLKDAGFTGRIRLDLYGEPTLHPDFFNLVHYIHTELPKCHITLFTNGFGVYHKGHQLSQYFACGVGDIIFDVYKETVDLYKNSEVPLCPDMTLNDVGVPFFVKTRRVLVNLPIEEQQGIKTRKFVNHCGAGAPALSEPICARCAHPFRDFTVDSWGEIMLCCNDFRGEYLVASIFDFEDFESAWNAPRLESARNRLYHKDRSFNPCIKCDSISHRAGLLPDKFGKKELPEPTERDKEITEYPYASVYIVPKRRDWEK